MKWSEQISFDVWVDESAKARPETIVAEGVKAFCIARVQQLDFNLSACIQQFSHATRFVCPDTSIMRLYIVWM